MKLLKIGVLFGVIGLFLAGCNDDEGYSLNDVWITIGNIEGGEDGFIIVTDGGTTLFPSANAIPGYPVEDGDRLWTNFTILGDGEEGSEIDHYVKINNFSTILTKGIFELTPETADSIGHDPVWVTDQEEDIWIANNYLNIFFRYEGSPWTTHYINVVSDVDNPTTPEGMPILELRHNSNDDPYTEPALSGFISIDLSSLQQEGSSEVTFLLRALGTSGMYDLEMEFTYTYGEPDMLSGTTIKASSMPTNFKVE